MKGNRQKLENMILYIASSPEVTNLGWTKLYKLIYFSDVHHLREYGHPISAVEYIKFPQGPVPDQADKVLLEMRKGRRIDENRIEQAPGFELRKVSAIAQPEVSVFDETEIKAMDEIIRRHGKDTAKKLSDLSHEDPAWIYASMRGKLSRSLMMYGMEEDAEGL